jgi:hypothetical protein
MLGYCKPPGGSDWAAIEVETNALVFEYTPLLAGLVPGLPYPIRSERFKLNVAKALIVSIRCGWDKADCVLAGALRDQFVIQIRTRRVAV